MNFDNINITLVKRKKFRSYLGFLFSIIIAAGSSFILFISNVAELIQSIELGLILFTALILIIYANATHGMKEELINQTYASLSPSIVVNILNYGSQHDQININIYNYSAENIAKNFKCEMYYNEKLHDSRYLEVIGYTGSNPQTASGRDITFGITKDQYNHQDKITIKYSFFDRTDKFKYEGEVRPLE